MEAWQLAQYDVYDLAAAKLAGIPSDTGAVAAAIAATPGGTQPTYTFTQNAPASTWVVAHNLGVYPITTIVVGGVEVIAEITHLSVDVLQVTFVTPTAGSARCYR